MDLKEKFNCFIDKSEKGIFVGSGISISSGIPSVLQFLPYFFKNVVGISNDTMISKLSENQFEVTMEIAFNVFAENRSHLFSIFDNNIRNLQPNATHYWIAEQILRKNVRNVYTTNFDTLIEQAIEDIGLLSGTNNNLKVYSTSSSGENCYLNIDWNNEYDINIIKPHGCITRPNEIAIDIKKIIAEPLQDKRRIITQDFFKQNDVLFLGYSMSDRFDITPYIEDFLNGKNRLTKIFFINHDWISNNEKIDYLKDVSNIRNEKHPVCFNPFKSVTKESLWFNTDTDILIKSSSNILREETETKHQKNWKSILDVIEQNTSNDVKKYAKLSYVSDFQSSEENFLLAKELLKEVKDEEVFNKNNIAVMHNFVGDELRKLGNLKKSLTHHKKAEKYFKKLNDKFSLADTYLFIGGILEAQNKFEEAVSYYNKTEMFYKSVPLGTKQKEGLGNALVIKAQVLYLQRKFENCFTIYQEALKIYYEIGNLYKVVTTQNELANLLRLFGEIKQAKDYYEDSINISLDCGYTNVLADSYLGLAYLQKEQQKFDLAFINFNNSREVNKKLTRLQSYALSTMMLGEMLIKQKKYTQAYHLILEAETIFDNAKDLGNLSYIYFHHAEILIGRKNDEDAIICLEKSHEIAIKAEDFRLVEVIDTLLLILNT